MALSLLFLIDPERVHNLSLVFLKWCGALRGKNQTIEDSTGLSIKLAGVPFANPIGLAAGYDKDARAARGLFCLGFSSVEVGTVTLKAHKGNDGNRLFRLRGDNALINRFGLNSEGVKAVEKRLQKARMSRGLPGPVGVNIGSSEMSLGDEIGHGHAEELASTFGELAGTVAPLADYIAVNLSCPNLGVSAATQTKTYAERILRAVAERIESSSSGDRKPPVFLKLSSSITDDDLMHVISLAREGLCHGLIIGNTLKKGEHDFGRLKSDLPDDTKAREGGLSGYPIFEPSTDALARAWRLSDGEIPLIGAGGVDSVDTAWEKIRHGASMVQLYTGLVYQGPGLPHRIVRGLEERLKREGYSHISEVVGSALRERESRRCLYPPVVRYGRGKEVVGTTGIEPVTSSV